MLPVEASVITSLPWSRVSCEGRPSGPYMAVWSPISSPHFMLTLTAGAAEACVKSDGRPAVAVNACAPANESASIILILRSGGALLRQIQAGQARRCSRGYSLLLWPASRFTQEFPAHEVVQTSSFCVGRQGESARWCRQGRCLGPRKTHKRLVLPAPPLIVHTSKLAQVRASAMSAADLERLRTTTAATSDSSLFKMAVRNVIAACRSSPLALAAHARSGVVLPWQRRSAGQLDCICPIGPIFCDCTHSLHIWGGACPAAASLGDSA